jgi:hypothetical protein
MFERFTDKARTVVILARAKAAERGDQIRPVYLLYATRAGTLPRRPSAIWASIPPRPGSACLTSCGTPRRDGGEHLPSG